MSADVTDLPLWRRLDGPGTGERWERRFGPGGVVGVLVTQRPDAQHGPVRWRIVIGLAGAPGFSQERWFRGSRAEAWLAAASDARVLLEIVEARGRTEGSDG